MSDTERKIKSGWSGRFFEDFEAGDIYRTRYGRTVTEADNLLFTHLTLNTNPLHFDSCYTARTKWGKILVNSTFTLSLIVGMSVSDVSENAMANLGWEKILLPNPVFIGDTLYSESEVIGKRASRKYPEAGIVTVRTRGINQDGKVVVDLQRNVMIYRRAHAPGEDLFPVIEEE